MYKTLCEWSILLTIINFILSILGLSETDILRFVPTLSYLMNLFTWVVLIFMRQGLPNFGKLTKWLYLWSGYVILNAVLIPSVIEGTVMTILQSLYWVSAFFIFGFWYKARKNNSNIDKEILIVFYIFVALSIYKIFFAPPIVYDYGKLVGNNVVFFPLLLLPWALSVKSTTSRLIALASMVLVALFSLKRSSIIVVFATILILAFNKQRSIKKGGFISKFGALIVFTIVVGFLLSSPKSPLEDVEERFSMISEDNGSGRRDIYEKVLFLYDSFDPINKVFGKGFKRVQYDLTYRTNDVSLSAHNDYIEVLYDYGLVGLIIYIVIQLIVLANAIKHIKQKCRLGVASLIFIVSVIILSIVSHLIIYPAYFLFASAFWAYAEVEYQKELLSNNYNG